MITKLKICSVCHDPCRLWVSHPPMCKNCSQLAKIADKKKQAGLTQTIDGKTARVFKAVKPIKKVGDKLAIQQRKYYKLRIKYLNEHRVCELRILCDGAPATDLHHVRPREFFLCDVTVFKAACRLCHDWIPSNDAEAREKGFLKSKHIPLNVI